MSGYYPHEVIDTVRKTDDKLEVIEIARGCAALMVVCYHASQIILWPKVHPGIFDGQLDAFRGQAMSYQSLYPFFGFGFLGVQLFFVLSGFCIHLPNVNRPTLDVRKFFVRRFFRLYPLYVVVCCVMFAVNVMLGTGGAGSTPFQNFFGHLFFWHYADGGRGAGMGIVPVMWTLTLEVWFYAIYALGFKWLKMVDIRKVAVWWLVADAGYHVIFELTKNQVAWPGFMAASRFPIARFGEWLLGAYLAESFVRDSRRRTDIVLGLLCFVVGIVLGGYCSVDKYFALDIPATLGFFFLLRYFLNRGSVLGQSQRTIFGRGFVMLGVVSYSLYLLHPLTLRVTDIAVVSSFELLGASLPAAMVRVASFACALTVSFMIAWISYLCLEEPMQALGRRLSDN